MRILFVINSLRFRRGAEVMLSNLLIPFSGFFDAKIKVVCLYDGIDETYLSAFKKHNIEYETCHKKRSLDFKAFKAFKKIVQDFNPDIINTHLSCLITYFFSFGFKKKNWKIIHTIHSVPSKESDNFTNLLRRIYIRKQMLYFIGITNQIAHEMVLMFPNAHVYTIYNGISLPSSINRSDIIYDYICVASMSEEKNHVLLINAFNEVWKVFKQATLLLVGSGPLLPKYKKIVNDLECKNNIIFYGLSKDVGKQLEKSRFFVLTSFYEGSPISILEAMSYGLPIIASNVGGVPDVVKNGENGFLFECNNLADLTDKMILMYSNDKNFDIISKNNIEMASRFSIELCAKKYFELFKRIKDGNYE